MNARARVQAAQRTRMMEGQTQVAAGKTFHGSAFVAKPEKVTFKDFDVGKRSEEHTSELQSP